MADHWDEILSEQFDHTWPYNFKWSYNGETGKADVWRVQGGVDGRPTHRQEARERWDRDPRVQDGDVLGVASYLPAEKKLDGSIVAPADIRIQAYYDQPVPNEVRQWFAETFPEATVRQAVIVPPRLGKTAFDLQPKEFPVIKWVWNQRDGLLMWGADEDNLPTHRQKALAEWRRPTQLGTGGFDGPAYSDFLGFAYPSDGKVEIESYDTRSIPPAALAAVKTQLAEWYPHDQIVVPDAPQHEFTSDPADYRSAARAWAQEHLGDALEDSKNAFHSSLEATPGKPGLLARLFRRKTAEADLDGADMEGSTTMPQTPVFLVDLIDEMPYKDPEKRKAASRKSALKLSRKKTDFVRSTKAAQGCRKCGETDPVVLVLHHPDDVEKHASLKGGRTRRVLQDLNWDDLRAEVDKCEVWCFNCHARHHDAELQRIDPATILPNAIPMSERTHCAKGHEFTKENTYQSKRGRNCRECMRTSSRAWKERQKFAGEDTPKVMYHVTRSINRPGILQMGLLASEPFVGNEHGVYLWNTKEAAERCVQLSLNEEPDEEVWDDDDAYDIWQVDLNGLTVKDDQLNPGQGGAMIVQGDIDPSQIKLIETIGEDPYWLHTASDDYLDWSGWEGAHRFITDGKELLTDPETERIDESQWRDPELEAKFRTLHPDAKSFVSGWTVPTADGMGVGIFAPAAGHGDKHEPGLHEIVKVIEKEFGKPAHFVTNADHLEDDRMYDPGEVSEWQTL